MDPENDPFQGVDLSQIDITDPETRSYVEQYVDLNDPETASFFGISSAPQAPMTSAPPEVGNAIESTARIVEAVAPGAGGEFIKGAQGTYGNLRPDESVTFGRDALGIEPLRIPDEVEKQILGRVEQAKGNKDFNQEALNQIYSDFGYQAGTGDEQFFEAVRNAQPTGNINYAGLDKQLVDAEAAKMRQAEEAFAATREGMEPGFATAVDEGAQDNFMWSGLSRGLRDVFDVGMDELKASNPGMSDEWYEEEMDKELIRQTRAARNYYAKENEDVGGLTRFAGNVLGNIDPTVAIGGPGKTILGRIAGMGAVETGLETVGQTGEVLAGVRDNYDPLNIAAAGVGGAVFQGAAEGIGKVLRSRRTPQELEAEVNSSPGPLDGTPYAPPSLEEEALSFANRPRDVDPIEARLAEEAAAFSPRREVTQEELFMAPEERAAQIEADLTPRLQEEADAFLANRTAQEPSVEEVFTEASTPRVTEEELDVRVGKMQQTVDELQSAWKNAPETFVIRDYDDLADPVIAARLKELDPEGTAKGVTMEDGSIALIGKNINSSDEVSAVLFHEALGHNGLTQRFGAGLDKTLESFYNTNPSFKGKVDEWISNNPSAYADGLDQIARAADEVLAEMSENGQIDVKLFDRIKNFVKDTMRRMGMSDVEYSDREIRTILGMAHDAVVNGKGRDVAENGFRFSRGEDTKTKKSLSPESMTTKNDIDDLLDFVGRENEGLTRGPISDVEVGRMVDDLGLTNSKYLKGKSIADDNITARIRGAHQLITNSVDELSGLRVRVEEQGLTPTLRATINQKLATLQALYARFDEDTAEIGRALRILRLTSESKQSSKAMDRFLRNSGEGGDIMDNEASLLRFLNGLEAAKVEGGAEAAGKFFNLTRKNHWEDYAGSIIFNNMLSSPRTWAVNAGGALMNHFIESVTLSTRASMGSLYRGVGGKGETTHLREVAAQQLGALMGVWNYRTWKDTVGAFRRGESSGNDFDGKVGGTGTPLTDNPNPLVKAAGVALENPRRIMAATDEFWNATFRMSELFRIAAHDVSERGDVPDGRFWQEVKALVQNPTPEMLSKVGDYSDRMLFRGTPSLITRKLGEVQKPRYTDESVIKMRADPETGKMTAFSKEVRPKDSQLTRAGRFGVRLAVPFAYTLDNIAGTLIRNAGPLAVIAPSVRKGLMTKGIEREAALGRIAASSAMLGFFWSMAEQGNITGAQNPDYKKQASLGSIVPPMSIKLGDEWMSYQGWDPIAGMMSAAATAYERSDGTLSPNTVTGMVSGFAEALFASSYAESLATSMKLFQEVYDGVTNGTMDKTTAVTNFLGGQAANLIPNASFTRWLNQEFFDKNARVTKGDSSSTDRILNRIYAGVPMLSQDIPAKYDILGREVLNPRQPRMIETDPVALEVHRLDAMTDQVLVGMVSDRVKKDGVPNTKLTAEEQQAYQKASGEIFYEWMSDLVNDPDWDKLSDEDKQVEMKLAYDDAKKAARSELFPEPGDDIIEEEDDLDTLLETTED